MTGEEFRLNVYMTVIHVVRPPGGRYWCGQKVDEGRHAEYGLERGRDAELCLRCLPARDRAARPAPDAAPKPEPGEPFNDPILAAIRGLGEPTAVAVAERLGLPIATVKHRLAKLRGRNEVYVARVKRTRARSAYVWAVAKK